jgi:hypothetical protein
MAEKSGYEIRESLLHLAYQIVVTNAHGRYQSTCHGAEPGTWSDFGVEDVVKVARELNGFVSEKPNDVRR